MNTVVLLGNDKVFGDSFSALLSKKCGIIHVTDKEITGNVSENSLLIIESNKKISLTSGICILKNDCKKIPEIDGIFIINRENARHLRLLEGRENVISCGSSGRDTLTFSGLDDNYITLSLQRSLTALNGVVKEPFELPVPYHGEEIYTVLAAACTEILLGII